MKKMAAVSMIAMMLALPSGGVAAEIDPNIGQYQQTSGVSGNLNSVGSDTLNNLMTFWAEGSRRSIRM